MSESPNKVKRGPGRPRKNPLPTAKALESNEMIVPAQAAEALAQYRSEAVEEDLLDDGTGEMEFSISLEGSIITDHVPDGFGQWRCEYECFRCGVSGHSEGPFYIRALCCSCGTPLTARRRRMKDED